MKNLIFLIVLQVVAGFLIYAYANAAMPNPLNAQTLNSSLVSEPSPGTLLPLSFSDSAQADCLQRVTSSPPLTVEAPAVLRSDIQLRQVITTTGNFIRLALDPITNNLFYMDAEANIYQLQLQPGTNATSTRVYSQTEIGSPPYTFGMAFGPDGTLYVVGNDTQAYTTRGVIRKGVLNQAGKRVWSTLASTVPYPTSGTFFDHRFGGIAASPDGQYVYVSSGSRTDHGEVQSNLGTFPGLRETALTAAILRLPTYATDLVLVNDEATLKAQGYLFAQGLRNAFDLAFGPNGDLFAVDNGPDADYPEELNWIRQGHHYGFPWRLGSYNNPQQFPNYDPGQDPWIITDTMAAQLGTYYNDPTFPAPPTQVFTDPVLSLGPDGDHFRDGAGCERDASQVGQPLYTFTPHRVPLGLAFDTMGSLAEPFKNDAFILSFGPTYRSMTDRGQDLLHLELTKIGESYQMQATQIVQGFNFPIDSVLVGNRLYVLEYGQEVADGQGSGAIWEVTLP